jgi:hypothetical protein
MHGVKHIRQIGAPVAQKQLWAKAESLTYGSLRNSVAEFRALPPGAPRPSQAIFTEGRKGNEETGIGSHQISKQALLLPLMVKSPRLFAIFCSKPYV